MESRSVPEVKIGGSDNSGLISFPSSKLRPESYDPLKPKKKHRMKIAMAFIRSLFSGNFQAIGHTVTMSNNSHALEFDSDEISRFDVELKRNIRIYPCGNTAVPTTYLVRNVKTEEFAVIDSKLANLLFNIRKVHPHD